MYPSYVNDVIVMATRVVFVRRTLRLWSVFSSSVVFMSELAPVKRDMDMIIFNIRNNPILLRKHFTH